MKEPHHNLCSGGGRGNGGGSSDVGSTSGCTGECTMYILLENTIKNNIPVCFALTPIVYFIFTQLL